MYIEKVTKVDAHEVPLGCNLVPLFPLDSQKCIGKLMISENCQNLSTGSHAPPY